NIINFSTCVICRYFYGNYCWVGYFVSCVITCGNTNWDGSNSLWCDDGISDGYWSCNATRWGLLVRCFSNWKSVDGNSYEGITSVLSCDSDGIMTCCVYTATNVIFTMLICIGV